MAYWSYAVTKMVAGMCSGPSSRITSSPVLPGICTSRKMRSGCSLRIASTAAAPSAAVPTSSAPSWWRSRSATRSRPSASSSTTRTRSRRSATRRTPEGKPNLGRHAGTLLRWHQGKPLIPTVPPPQPGQRILQSHSTAIRLGRQPERPGIGAVVAHPKHQHVTLRRGLDGDASPLVQLLHPVLDRVLHQRLQHQRRHQRIQRLVSDLLPHIEPALESNLHDVEVAPQQLQLLPERNLRTVLRVQAVPQQLTQPCDHPPHSSRIALHQR